MECNCKMGKQQPWFASRHIIAITLVIAMTLSCSGYTIADRTRHLPVTPIVTKTVTTSTAKRPKNDQKTIRPPINLALPTTTSANISMDALSPALTAHLAHEGNNVGAAVYDITHQRYYAYNANAQFIMASSIKVPIVLAFLGMIEKQGRILNAQERSLLRTMIENSNNDSASELYYHKIAGAAGIVNLLRRTHITGLVPAPDAWGYSLTTPFAMMNLLTLLYQGTMMTAQNRNLTLGWMEHIETDQRAGVGDTAPEKARVAMKNGWVPGPDGLWAVNSSGIVNLGQETYIIAVYAQKQQALANGQAILQQICRAVASSLFRREGRWHIDFV
jgi:hypothetical protein